MFWTNRVALLAKHQDSNVIQKVVREKKFALVSLKCLLTLIRANSSIRPHLDLGFCVKEDVAAKTREIKTDSPRRLGFELC